MVKDSTDIEKKIGYLFKDRGLLSQSLTHGSSVGEGEERLTFDRLEFIGDAVIGLVIAGALFEMHPERDEGWLTQVRANLVDEASLTKRAMEIDLGTYIILGKGEEISGGRMKPSILSDAFEALIGAIFLDGGYGVSETIVKSIFRDALITASQFDPKNYKSILQEKLQKKSMPPPRYEIISSTGPDHDKTFEVAVFWGDGNGDGDEERERGRGVGKTKKEAETMAARDSLKLCNFTCLASNSLPS